MEFQVCEGFDWGRGARRAVVAMSGITGRERERSNVDSSSQVKSGHSHNFDTSPTKCFTENRARKYVRKRLVKDKSIS